MAILFEYSYRGLVPAFSMRVLGSPFSPASLPLTCTVMAFPLLQPRLYTLYKDPMCLHSFLRPCPRHQGLGQLLSLTSCNASRAWWWHTIFGTRDKVGRQMKGMKRRGSMDPWSMMETKVWHQLSTNYCLLFHLYCCHSKDSLNPSCTVSKACRCLRLETCLPSSRDYVDRSSHRNIAIVTYKQP